MPSVSPPNPRAQRWRQLVADWQHSGLSVRAFCERRGLAVPTFYLWRRRLQASPPAATFVPVRVRDQATLATAGQYAGLELVLPHGCCLRVPVGFDADTLRQLLAVLEEPAC
jgi:hypothetical protein